MELHVFYSTLLASIIACLVTTLGIYVINRFRRWGLKNVGYFICFAAGVLISVSFLHIIPKSFEMSSLAPVFLLVGFFGLFLLNRFLKVFLCDKSGVCDTSRGEGYVFGIIPMLGIGIHSFIDGVIYSVTFNVHVFTGILAAIGMIFHEFPEGIVTYILLMKSGFSKKKSLLYSFTAAAITTPLGVLISFPFVSSLNKTTLGILLSLSAGALVYVGTTHLLPEAEKESKKFSIVALALGILVAVIIILSKG
ncbi:ZIP family metal transporter [Candidatus Woesearchaeota archaeon]|nr:ZIP family metal transporter [Candidatus Woesearchaeota archaeon]